MANALVNERRSSKENQDMPEGMGYGGMARKGRPGAQGGVGRKRKKDPEGRAKKKVTVSKPPKRKGPGKKKMMKGGY